MTTAERVAEIQAQAAEALRLTQEVVASVATLAKTDNTTKIQALLKTFGTEHFVQYAALLTEWVSGLDADGGGPASARPVPLAMLPLAHGTLTVVGGQEPDYPGYAIEINDQTAAVVEWHPEYQALVLRTYTVTDDEPHTYHTWDGRRLEP